MSENKRNFRVGLGVSGGIAAYKAIEILRGLQKAGCAVRVAMTAHATEFIQPLTFRALNAEYVLVNDYAPGNPDPIAHINFSQEIDLLLIAPATANIIAKFANGVADDFLSSTYLASTAPVLIAPAMNTTMWFHPATQRNIEQLKADGVKFVEPVSGELACQTVGTGKLEDVGNIVRQALELLVQGPESKVRSGKLEIQRSKPEVQSPEIESQNENIASIETLDLKDEHFLITIGGTREEIDPVRYISNHSSGKMGFALADAARKRGAAVTAVVGIVTVEPPQGINIIKVASAEEMYQAVMKELGNKTIFIGAAAVADYRPKRAAVKIKKDSDKLTLELEKTPDILYSVSMNRPAPSTDNEHFASLELIVIGFAAETNNLEDYARSKMNRKNLDILVANDVSDKNIGFGSDHNQGFILRRYSKDPIVLAPMKKREMADKILDEVLKLRKINQGMDV